MFNFGVYELRWTKLRFKKLKLLLIVECGETPFVLCNQSVPNHDRHNSASHKMRAINITRTLFSPNTRTFILCHILIEVTDGHHMLYIFYKPVIIKKKIINKNC